MIDKKDKFLIVGLGLMGGSYAEKLTQSSYQVYAIDISKESIEIGKRRKIIKNKDESNEELIKNSDYIILALPPSLCYGWVKNHQYLFKNQAILTDMMGVKSHIVEDIQAILNNQELISMHPMTGKELSGVNYASSNIFNSSNMLIVPTIKNSKRSIDFAYQLAKILEVKNVKEVSVEEHDRVVGYVSHLSHVIAVTLMNAYDSKSIKDYAGTSFKDITRIANINEEIWTELFLENKNQLVPLINQFSNQLEKLKEAINNEDKDQIKLILKESKEKRQAFNKE